jgi:hypothetical protein
MPQTVENPQKTKVTAEITPPIQATAFVEAEHGIKIGMDTQATIAIKNSNMKVGNLLANTLKSCLRLSKTLFTSVTNWSTVASGLGKIIKGT